MSSVSTSTHPYNTRLMMKVNASMATKPKAIKHKRIRSNIRLVQFENELTSHMSGIHMIKGKLLDGEGDYNLRMSPRVNYYRFYRNYHEKFDKEIRRSPRISNMKRTRYTED